MFSREKKNHAESKMIQRDSTVSCWRRKRDLNPEMNVIIKNETLLFQDIIKIIIHFVCNFCLLISENMLIHLLQHIRRRMSHAFHCILVGYV